VNIRWNDGSLGPHRPRASLPANSSPADRIEVLPGLGQSQRETVLYQLLVVEERLREQGAEGVRMPEGMEPDELALRILVTAILTG
jgi:hypothetical protein